MIFFWVSNMGAESPGPTLSSAAFLGHKQVAWLGSGAASTRTVAHMGYGHLQVEC